MGNVSVVLGLASYVLAQLSATAVWLDTLKKMGFVSLHADKIFTILTLTKLLKMLTLEML